MKRIAQREFFLVGAFALLFLVFLFPALMHARQEARDGIRRDEVAAFKRLLEQHYNEYEAYPLIFDASPHRYVVVEQDDKGATTWYLQAEMENDHPEMSDFDAEEGRNYYWRYVQNEGRTYYEVCGGAPSCGI